ncbi:thiamine-phosphate kinase [Paenibacillus albiflavus]|uniref:Thiamine-monophosphate kinase n=1 Tax=Paenibacillus albiflavus TaxID=2545760 RepID=A0A4R4EED7_9BACL|nr:thiamine-phosphate kinase [Paenibacillus albiflavus]TCZ76385.1 thiamine-phosphate kinase [Paenibacillus albiflavus]
MDLKDEFALIDLLTCGGQSTHWQRERGVGVGIGDDAAVAGISPGCSLVMACDTMTQHVHFASWSMRDEDIGFKAMASNISDMAAMGAVPRYALIALSVPKGTDEARLQRIYAGMYECASAYEVAIVGGDTTASISGIVITVTILGEVEAGRALLRSHAKTGDAVFVTGALGGSAAGLALLEHAQRSGAAAEAAIQAPLLQALALAHQRPAPQVAAGRLLLRTGLGRALNDISDGIASEAAEIAEASRVGLAIEEARLPRPAGLDAAAQLLDTPPLEWMLYGGEDYQLLGTVAKEHVHELEAAFEEHGLKLYVIGYATDDFSGVRLLRADGTVEPLAKRGYNHFATKD